MRIHLQDKNIFVNFPDDMGMEQIEKQIRINFYDQKIDDGYLVPDEELPDPKFATDPGAYDIPPMEDKTIQPQPGSLDAEETFNHMGRYAETKFLNGEEQEKKLTKAGESSLDMLNRAKWIDSSGSKLEDDPPMLALTKAIFATAKSMKDISMSGVKALSQVVEPALTTPITDKEGFGAAIDKGLTEAGDTLQKCNASKPDSRRIYRYRKRKNGCESNRNDYEAI